MLCSRVLRDYLLYAADLELLSVTNGMRAVHGTAVARLPGATDASTLAALRRAGAPATAELMSRLLEPGA
ncbi:hypothetical protein [Promicromonospora sp. NPDC050262]|uniref:hypothetical protein n=1 Tax=Promicromonospora sp. NPDC050262 TaxID=3155036 RepID=UPI0033D0E1A0